MAKNTPKWRVRLNVPCAAISGSHIIEEAKYPHQPVGLVMATKGRIGPSHGIEKAHLAAAAPELLKQLIACIAFIEGDSAEIDLEEAYLAIAASKPPKSALSED